MDNLITILNSENEKLKQNSFSYPDKLFCENNEIINFCESKLRIDGFNQNVFYGGIGQGEFHSYFSIAFWKIGDKKIAKGSFSYVNSCSVYISYIGLTPIITYSQTKWSKRTSDSKKGTYATPIGYDEECKIDGSSIPHPNWEEFDETLKSILLTFSSQIYDSIELSKIPAKLAWKLQGIKSDPPTNLLGVLFHGGTDYEY